MKKKVARKPKDDFTQAALAKNNRTFHKLPNGTIGLPEWYPEVVKRMQTGSRAVSLNPATFVDSDEEEDATEQP